MPLTKLNAKMDDFIFDMDDDDTTDDDDENVIPLSEDDDDGDDDGDDDADDITHYREHATATSTRQPVAIDVGRFVLLS